jgi:hypothetical protein
MAENPQSDPYASIAKPIADDPYAAIAQRIIQPTSATKASTPTPPSFFDRLRTNLGRNTADPKNTGGFLHDNVVAPLQRVANRAGQDIANPLIDFAQDVHDPSGAVAARRLKQGEDAFNASPLNPDAKGSAVGGAAELMGNAIPLLSGVGTQVRQYAESPHPLTDIGGDALTAGIMGGMAKTLPQHGPIEGTRQLLSSGVDKPIPGEGNATPRERYNTAKSYGVDLNAADATNNPILNVVRHTGENSLLGGPTYEAARAKNVGALNTAADTTLDAMSPLSREEGGTLMQKNLEGDRQRLEGGASDRFEDLSAAMGNRPMDGSEALGKLAQNIREQETPFNEKYPHLVPKQAMGIINDVADRFQPGEPVKSSLLDEFGKPIYTDPPPPLGLTYPEAQNIRSRTMDVTRRTNDLTADRGIGMLKQIVGGADDAITNSAGGLNPNQLEIYRDANQRYAEMKDKYDNPQSPLYSAIRTDNPSSLTKGIGQKTPEQVRDLIPRLGPEGTGAMQRGVAEQAMGTDKNGNRNLAGFGKRFYSLPEDYRQELFQPNPLFAGENPPMSDDFHQPLQDLASTSTALSNDLNPSGSGKLAQKILEGGALFHPATMAAPLLQYPAAKLMHSPAAIDWLMKPSSLSEPQNPFFAPAAAVAGAESPKKRGLYGTR